MRIAILIGHFPPGAFGGAELQAEHWARLLSDRHEVTVITRRDPPDQPAHEQRGRYRVLRLPVARWPGLRTLLDLLAIERTVARLEPRPDVLLCFQTFVSGLAGVRAGRRLGIPALVWIRAEAEYRFEASPLFRWIGPYVWRNSRAVLVQSKRIRDDLLAAIARHAPGAAEAVRSRLEVVANGIELPAQETPLGEGVLTVGRLIPDKGMDTVIDAMAIAGGELVIAGEGPLRGELERRARAAGVPARFTGFVGREELARLYEQAGYVVLAARRNEGLPNVLLEGMAHGRVVIATDCAGAGDLVKGDANGIRIPADDPVALAAAIIRARGDESYAAWMCAGAFRTAQRHGWAHVREQLEAVLARRVGA